MTNFWIYLKRPSNFFNKMAFFILLGGVFDFILPLLCFLTVSEKTNSRVEWPVYDNSENV